MTHLFLDGALSADKIAALIEDNELTEVNDEKAD